MSGSASKMTQAEYDAAQTLALTLRDEKLQSVAMLLDKIKAQPGCLDLVDDCLADIERAVAAAKRINDDVSLDKLEAYDETVVACQRCGRRYQRRHGCVCRG